MPSRHYARARRRRTQRPRSPAEDARIPGLENGTMGDKAMSAIAEEVHTDYGSDIDVHSLPALSDYGSEIDPNDVDEDTLVGDLLVKIAATAPKAVIYPNIEVRDALERGEDEGVVDASRPALLRATQSSPVRHRSASVEIEYDAPSRRAFSEAPPEAPAQAEEPSPPRDDTRTPLQRFRTKPKKPLSVTDLVSPAWCELQYFYTLSKFGRKPPTLAMKAGTKVHETLEDEVHTVVPVQVKTKEDRFGLRIWNTIQGLRCLRETGLTRELQVWGVIEGQVVNGVIDELSYTCLDLELEEQLELSKAEKSGGTLPLGMLSIQHAFAKTGAPPLEKGDNDAWIGRLEPDRQVYIADVKTRGVRSVPAGASLRPIWMQLMLYRKLLESLSLNTVDAETVLARYNLKPLESFSEVFMREVGATDGEDMQTDDSPPSSMPQSSELRSHPNLLSLWSLMITEFQQTIPTISDILRAEFRYSKTGHIIGSELTVYDSETIGKYVKEVMEWWKGGRVAKGVEIEEAFKCRVCDFAGGCSWRRTKIEEATEKHRLRRGKREKSAV